jgi:hypothetical protein
MIFQSQKVLAQWDTWLFYYEGIHYLYYLITRKKDSGGGGKFTFEGIGMATSSDGVHFEDIGPVIEPSEKMVFMLGTGSVWKDPKFSETGLFFMNYSECRQEGTAETQHILFARSADLIHWEKYGDEKMFSADEDLYEPHGRWDCINTCPREEGGYWGNWTATPLGRGASENGIGMGYSEDGLNWIPLPPPEVSPIADEAGDFMQRDGVWYALFGRSGDMAVYTADDVEGPYVQQKKNSLLIKGPHTYFARLYDCNGELLLNHHAMDGKRIHGALGDMAETYLAPLKKVVFDREGTLRAVYWPGNDALKGEPIPIVKETAPPGITFLTESVDFTAGIYVEGRVNLAEGPAILLFVDNKSFAVRLSRRRISFGDWGPFVDGYQEKQWCDRDREFPGISTFRLLARKGMVELYLDEELVECWKLDCPDALFVRPAIQGDFPAAHVCSMTL